MTQQIKDLTCHCSRSGCCCDAGWIPGLGASTCFGHSQNKQTKITVWPCFRKVCWLLICVSKFFFFFGLFRALLAAYGGSQARGPIRAGAASLHHSHSNARSKPCLQTTPQLTTTPDPQPTEQGQGSNPQSHGSQSDSFLQSHNGNSSKFFN